MASGLKPVSCAQIDFSNTGSIPAAFAAARIRSFHRIATPEGGGVSLAEASSDVLPDELPPSPAAANAKLGLKSRYSTTAAATATRLNAPISPEFIFISPVYLLRMFQGLYFQTAYPAATSTNAITT